MKDFLRSVRSSRPGGFEVRFEIPPGRQAQVDFAHFRTVFTDEPGVERIVWLFSLVLGHGIGNLFQHWLAGTSWPDHAGPTTAEPATYPGYRFPAEIISYTVWLYYVFSLSLRDVELILAERGIPRQWCLKFGADIARKMRRRRPKPGTSWHLDEVFLRINGELHYLGRAVDKHGVVLDILVQERQNAAAAKRFFKRLLAGLKFKPSRIVTDGLKSYGVAH